MIFKEAFEHYKSGIATPEEAAYIEQELEKNQLLSEYSEDDFNFNPESESAPAEELKKVKKSIRKRSHSIIVISVAIVVVLALLANFVAVPLLNNLYYNPMTKENDIYSYDIDLSFTAYTELHHAGYYYSNTLIENTGIGKYSMTLVRANASTGKPEYFTATLNKNHFTMPYSYSASFLPMNSFARASTPVYNFDSEEKERFIKELKALPDYMNVTAAVSFSEDLTMDQLINLMGNSKVNFLWTGIRNSPEGVQRYPLCGMDLTGAGVIYEHINDKYPAFELSACSDNRSFSASDYETHFTSLLRYTIDHADFLNALYANKNEASYYQSVLDYVTENGVKTYGVLVNGSAADILAMMDSGTVSQIWPLDAKVTF